MPLTPERARPIDWAHFDVTDADIEVATNLLLEREVPLTSTEMARAIVDRRLQARAEAEALASADPDARMYFPKDPHAVGDRLVFPALDGARGTVTGRRPGINPDLGPFLVVQVRLEGESTPREFAAELEDHGLNAVATLPADEPAEDGVEAVMQQHSRQIEAALDRRLGATRDIVRIAGRWFPAALLAEIHQGHLNLAEAVLDVSAGGPLPTSELLAHVELPETYDSALAQFSLDFALQQDERFDEVGPAGQVLWYLQRLEPTEVLFTPPHLEALSAPEDRARFTEELLTLETALDDELSPLDLPWEAEDEVVLPLLFPHWRVGALPLSSRLRGLFPTAYEAPRIRFILVDGHSGEKFPGWVVRKARYVFGLDAWYRRYEVPAGGLVRVRRGAVPGEVVVEAVERRRRNEWIRTAVVRPDGSIGFTMLKQGLGTSYEERMVVGVADIEALDAAWLQAQRRREPAERIVQNLFLEQAKLNPQTAVHAEALYSGVNVVGRMSPGAVFTCLLDASRYAYVGDLYWRRGDTAESAHD